MKKTYKNWSDITIEQYIELINESKNINNEIDLIYTKLEVLFGMTEQEIDNIQLTELNKIKQQLLFLDREPSQTKVQLDIEVDGVKYSLQHNFGKMTFGRLIMMEELKKKDFINNIPQILNLLYLDEKGNEMGIEKIKQLDCEVALSAFFFLYLKAMSYIPSDIQDCSMLDKMITNLNQSKKELKKVIRKHKKKQKATS
jgi:hypothetical protein